MGASRPLQVHMLQPVLATFDPLTQTIRIESLPELHSTSFSIAALKRNAFRAIPGASPSHLEPHAFQEPCAGAKHCIPGRATCRASASPEPSRQLIRLHTAGRGRQQARRVAAQGMQGNVDKAVLAYSGGLDTSVILKWLREEYDCEVITFTADLGQV